MERKFRSERGERQLSLSDLSGKPAYFFDTRFLQQRVSEVAGWSQERFEEALAPRFARALDASDIRITAEAGFVVVFDSLDPFKARRKADEICTDILTHFFGAGEFTHADAQQLCRPSTSATIANQIGPAARPAKVLKKKPANQGGADEDEKQLFARELIETYHAAMASSESLGYQFSPLWDSKHERIASYACELIGWRDEEGPDITRPEISTAVGHCRIDVLGLVRAAKGVLHINGRGELAAVCITVHASTLTWTKTRNAYLSVLAQMDPRIRSFFAPRIIGISPGFNLPPIVEWTRAIGQFSPWCFLHLPNLDFDLSRLGSLGFRGIAVSEPALSRPQNGIVNFAAQATKLKGMCASQKANPYADEIVSLRDLKILKEVGIRGIGGSVIGEPALLPGAIGSLSWNEIVKRNS